MTEWDESSIVLFTATIMVCSSYLGSRIPNPVVAIFNRWIRWISFSLTSAVLLRYFEWSYHPLWALSMMCFLGWFLLESIYNWLAIDALSRSDYPLFPNFQENKESQDLLSDLETIRIKTCLEERGFMQVSSLVSVMFEDFSIKSCIYDSEDKKIRLQTLITPNRKGHFVTSFSLSSQLKDGKRFITDNFFMPYGGFYPESWFLKRLPWRRSLNSLLTFHFKRLEKIDQDIEVWESDPLTDYNTNQNKLDQINTELGFLWPHQEREEHGRITWEGRYRVWKEFWCLAYLGIPRSYI